VSKYEQRSDFGVVKVAREYGASYVHTQHLFSPLAHPYVGHMLLRIRRARPVSSPTMQKPLLKHPTGWQ
jgi:hypothetical protein